MDRESDAAESLKSPETNESSESNDNVCHVGVFRNLLHIYMQNFLMNYLEINVCVLVGVTQIALKTCPFR